MKLLNVFTVLVLTGGYSSSLLGAVSIHEFRPWFNGETSIVQFYGEDLLAANPSSNSERESAVQLRLFKNNGAYAEDFASASVIKTGWRGEEKPQQILIQKDGKILLVVSSELTRTSWKYLHIVRFLHNGQRDKSFGTDGVVSLNEPKINTMSHLSNGVFEGPDSFIYVIKLLCGRNGCENRVLLRLQSKNGKVDEKFGKKGEMVLDIPIKKYLQVYPGAHGFLVNVRGDNDFSLHKFGWNGLKDKNFNEGPKNLLPVGRAGFQSLEILPDEKILLTGGSEDGSLAMTRLLPSGEVDLTFGDQGFLNKKEAVKFGLFNSAVAWYDTVRKCIKFGPSLGGVTLTVGNFIYVAAPAVASSDPSSRSDIQCVVNKISVGVAKYDLQGRFQDYQQSPIVGEAYAAWRLKTLSLSQGKLGTVRGIFMLGGHLPDDIWPQFKEFNGSFDVQ